MGSRYSPGSELILKEGTTTANGAGGATTLIDSALIGENDFLTNTSVIIISGVAQYEVRDITGFNTANGTITVSPAFSAQIVSGVGYRILAISSAKAEVDAIQADVGDASAAALGSLYGILGNPATSISDSIAATAAGKAQIVTATIDLNQAAATYDLLTGTAQNVMVEKLVIRMPDLAAGGALTSISIQTDDTTPQVFIPATLGAVANLTAQAQLSCDSPIIVATGKKVRLTIAGGAHGVAYSCTVTVMYRSVVAGGYLV